MNKRIHFTGTLLVGREADEAFLLGKLEAYAHKLAKEAGSSYRPQDPYGVVRLDTQEEVGY